MLIIAQIDQEEPFVVAVYMPFPYGLCDGIIQEVNV